MPTFSVIIPTYGDRAAWEPLAIKAVESAHSQTVAPLEVLRVHETTLAEARNKGARWASGDYLIFLDADDTLDPNYVKAMGLGTHPLRQPATLGVYEDGHTDEFAVVIPSRPSIRERNWFVIGTAIERNLFQSAEGFKDEPAWEDWSLMLRCFALGASWETVESAVYRVGVHPESRNMKAVDNRGLFQRILTYNDGWARERGLRIL